MSDVFVLEPPEPQQAPKPITPEQWVRILKGESYAILVKPEQQEWAGKRSVKCSTCKNTKMHQAPARGWCVKFRVLVSDTFPRLCPGHEWR